MIIFLFTTNSDLDDFLIFGKDIQTWLIYASVFFGVTLIAFLAVWSIDLLRTIKSGKSVKQPWD